VLNFYPEIQTPLISLLWRFRYTGRNAGHIGMSVACYRFFKSILLDQGTIGIMKRTKPQIQVNEGKEQRASSIIMVAADSYLSKERKKSNRSNPVFSLYLVCSSRQASSATDSQWEIQTQDEAWRTDSKQSPYPTTFQNLSYTIMCKTSLFLVLTCLVTTDLSYIEKS